VTAIILRSLADVSTIPQRVAKVWNGKPLELALKPYKPKRSIDQNSRLWMLHTLTAQHLNRVLGEELAETRDPLILAALRNPWTSESVHQNIFKPQFCGGRSSTKLSKMEMVDAQTDYERWMCEIGVVFPEQEYA
jgi:hypothetical protein